MKASTMILGALAAVATAAPTKVETRSNRDFSSFGNFGDINNFDFLNQDLQYLSLVNSLDFGVLAQLSQVNNLDVLQFGGVFNNDVFDLASALQFQQVAQLVQLSSLGAFNSLDLSGLLFNQLNFGVLQNDLFGLNLGGFVNQAVIPQVVQVINGGGACKYQS
jgi:hypothetical protein